MLSAHPIAWAGQPKALPGLPMARGWPTLGVVSGISYWRSWGTLWALECDASLSAQRRVAPLSVAPLRVVPPRMNWRVAPELVEFEWK